jgi:hypothetical protein
MSYHMILWKVRHCRGWLWNQDKILQHEPDGKTAKENIQDLPDCYRFKSSPVEYSRRGAKSTMEDGYGDFVPTSLSQMSVLMGAWCYNIPLWVFYVWSLLPSPISIGPLRQSTISRVPSSSRLDSLDGSNDPMSLLAMANFPQCLVDSFQQMGSWLHLSKSSGRRSWPPLAHRLAFVQTPSSVRLWQTAPVSVILWVHETTFSRPWLCEVMATGQRTHLLTHGMIPPWTTFLS